MTGRLGLGGGARTFLAPAAAAAGAAAAAAGLVMLWTRRSLSTTTTPRYSARHFDRVPGPPALPLIGLFAHAPFLPSIGVFHNVACPERLERLRAQYGDVVRLGSSADLHRFRTRDARRSALFLFHPDDILQVYESPGCAEAPRFLRSPLAACRARGAPGDNGGVRAALPEREARCAVGAALEYVAVRAVHRLSSLTGGARAVELNAQLEEVLCAWALETVACAALGAGAALGVSAAPPALLHETRRVFAGGFLQRSARTLRPHTDTYRDALHSFCNHHRLCELWLQELKPDAARGEVAAPPGEATATLLADTLLAGVDPLRHTATRLLYYLALNPAKQQRLRDEVAASERAGAHYAAACVREALRLHTVTGGCVLRRTSAPLQLAGYAVPPGVDVVLAHYSASRRESEFSRPSAFVPERWTCERGSPLDAAHAHRAALHPWGSACTGRLLAERALAALAARTVARHTLQWRAERPALRTAALHYLPPPYSFVLQRA